MRKSRVPAEIFCLQRSDLAQKFVGPARKSGQMRLVPHVPRGIGPSCSGNADAGVDPRNGRDGIAGREFCRSALIARGTVSL